VRKISGKKIFEKKALKKDRSRLKLIFQIYDQGHEVTPLKANPKKQRSKILNQIIIEG
jgi:hypothetical protein